MNQHAIARCARPTRRAALTAAIVAALLPACGDDQDPAGARELWQQIHALEYRSWDRAPGYEERRSSDAPHSNAVDIYVNDVLAKALATKQPLSAWPEGSLIVKDGFDGSDLELVAVMDKRADGWFYAEYGGDGEADYSGKPDLCIDCHRSGDDYVRAFALPD